MKHYPRVATNRLLLVIPSLCCLVVLAGCANIQWEYDYNRAASKAADLNQPMFIYFRDWLNPASPRMENEVLRQPQSELLLRETVNVFLDIRLYEDVANRYLISRAPAFVVTRPNGDPVDSFMGIPTLEDFVWRVNRAKELAKPIPKAPPVTTSAIAGPD